MDIDRFLAERSGDWSRLEHLARRVRRPRRATATELEEFVGLYHRVSADLSLARARHPDPAVVARLSTVLSTARTRLDGRRARTLTTLGRFFTDAFPAAVWALRRFVVVSALLFFVPAAVVGIWISRSPAALEASAPEALRAAYVERDFEAYYSDRAAGQFTTEVSVNNVRVAIFAYAGGITVGLGTVGILVANGFSLGFAAGLFGAAGEQARFFGLVTPHGLLELSAVTIAGAAGLSLAWALLVPGDRRRADALITAGQRSLTVILGLILVFATAGVIEGFVTGSTLSTAMRVGVGVAGEVTLLAYLVVFGRRATTSAADRSRWPSDC